MKKLFVIALFISCFSSIFAFAENVPEYKGDWKEGTRSLPVAPSITVTGSSLKVQSLTGRSDITIRISQGDEVVFEQTFPSSETKLITVALSGYEEGCYFLELSNQWGGYLYGNIYIAPSQ